MRKYLVFAFLALSVSSTAYAGDYKGIVNGSSTVHSLSRSQVSALFLKRVTAWENGGGDVHPVEPPEGPVREKFCLEVIGKSYAAIKVYWTRLTFAGRDTPPASKASDEEVVAFVRNTPGSIGYVSEAASTAGVNVIAVSE
jgi:ABC-type phosphate transport system substrate-binding protein